jgi:hypothetical protein
MAPKILKGLAKIIHPKKRRSGNGKASSSTSGPPNVISVPKPPSSRVSSSTTCRSTSGYLSEPGSPLATTTTPKTVDTMMTTTTTTTTTMIEDPSITWCGSGSDSETPSSPILRRPNHHRSKSATTKSHPLEHHHHQSVSFRVRKRNRALSDVDFDQLLTQSRGWTFDPSTSFVEPQQRRQSLHTRQNSLAQTDFERYIFSPTDTANKLRERRASEDSYPDNYPVVLPPTSMTDLAASLRSMCDTPPPEEALVVLHPCFQPIDGIGYGQ